MTLANMAGYTKLFSSIVTSTIWREPSHVRIVWITMLALADKNGVVEASVPGLGDMARVDRAQCEDALRVLLSPDPDSRTKVLDGRRIVAIDGGWHLVNHEKHRNRMSLDEKREKTAAYMREYRARKASRNTPPLQVGEVGQAAPDPAPAPKAEADPEGESPARTRDPTGTTTIGKTSWGAIQRSWADARREEFGGSPFASTHGLSPGAIQNVLEAVNSSPEVTPFIERSMREFWGCVKAGTHRESKKCASIAAFAFGCWWSEFAGDAERYMGVAPVIEQVGKAARGGRSAGTQAFLDSNQGEKENR